LNSYSDNALMLKVKSGDLSKLGLLFERYHKPLFGFFYRNTSKRELSEDLVQTLFERILKYRKNFKGEGMFTTWMYRIARNVLIDHYKQYQRKESMFNYDDDMSKYLLKDDQDLESVELKHLCLRKAMDKLDSDKLEIIILSRYQGLKYKEIAEIMGTTEGAIRIKMFRALNDLRKHFLKIQKTVTV